MKATLQLPEETYQTARHLAAREGLTVAELFARMIRRKLRNVARHSDPNPTPPAPRDVHEWRQELL